jgi:L-proline amide hydrolase
VRQQTSADGIMWAAKVKHSKGTDAMPSVAPVSEGFVPFRGFRTWYRVVGDLAQPTPAKFPLLVLHGGPGESHDYLQPLEELAVSGCPIIFYDQLGGGNSDQPNDPSLWSVELFLEELATVRQELGLDHTHLLGYSWGGMLAMEYALTQPAGLASLILASSPASIPQWIDESNRLRRELPEEVEETLLHHEEAGTTDDAAYEEAMMVYEQRHVCRLDPWPEPWMRTLDKLMANPEVYNTMFGPSEFHATGTLKEWDIRDRLGEIQLPTLVTSGRYDAATPAIAETVHRGIAGSEWVIFEQSSHMAHLEEDEEYRRVVEDFLRRVEEGQA